MKIIRRRKEKEKRKKMKRRQGEKKYREERKRNTRIKQATTGGIVVGNAAMRRKCPDEEEGRLSLCGVCTPQYIHACRSSPRHESICLSILIESRQAYHRYHVRTQQAFCLVYSHNRRIYSIKCNYTPSTHLTREHIRHPCQSKKTSKCHPVYIRPLATVCCSSHAFFLFLPAISMKKLMGFATEEPYHPIIIPACVHLGTD